MAKCTDPTPEDVQRARSLVDAWRKSWLHPVFCEEPLDEEQSDLATNIAHALSAVRAEEREAAAKTVEAHMEKSYFGELTRLRLKEMAEAIRKGTPA